MLKFALLALTLIQTSFCNPSPTTTEKPSFISEYLSSLPHDKMKAIVDDHLKTDPGFQAAYIYLKGAEFEQLVEDVRNLPDWVAYKKMLRELGLDVEEAINMLKHCLNDTDVSELKPGDAKPSVDLFFADVKDKLGQDFLKTFQHLSDEVAKDPKQVEMISQVVSDKSREMLNRALDQPAFKKLMEKLKEIGVNVDALLNLVYVFAGWKEATEVTGSTVTTA